MENKAMKRQWDKQNREWLKRWNMKICEKEVSTRQLKRRECEKQSVKSRKQWGEKRSKGTPNQIQTQSVRTTKTHWTHKKNKTGCKIIGKSKCSDLSTRVLWQVWYKTNIQWDISIQAELRTRTSCSIVQFSVFASAPFCIESTQNSLTKDVLVSQLPDRKGNQQRNSQVIYSDNIWSTQLLVSTGWLLTTAVLKVSMKMVSI